MLRHSPGKPFDNLLMTAKEITGHTELVFVFDKASLAEFHRLERLFNKHDILIHMHTDEESRKSRISRKPGGFKLTTATGIEIFLKKGGKIIVPGLLLEAEFEKKSFEDAVIFDAGSQHTKGDIVEIAQQMRRKLARLGVDYSPLTPTSFEIKGSLNLRAIACSGGVFEDMQEYRDRNGTVRGA